MTDDELRKKMNEWLSNLRATAFGRSIAEQIESDREDKLNTLLSIDPADTGRIGWIQGYIAALDSPNVVFGKGED